MAIRKRKPKKINPPLTKKPVKLHPRVRKHHAKCDALYNRLQRDTDDDIRGVMNEITGIEMSAHLWVQVIMAKFDCQITTLQCNGGYGKGATYRCFMTYTDRDRKPRHGHIYPRMSAVSTSTTLIHSVILSYIATCKQIGYFP